MSTAYKGYQVGDIYHLSGVFMHKLMGIDYFLSAGLNRTDNRFVDHYGMYPGLLNAPGEDENHWGWAAFLGVRIPVEQLNSKIGLEYNHGSQYWISFTPAADDLYLSKLATRGDVAEVYWIYDIGYRARIRNHGHSCFLCEIVIRSQFHTTYEPEA
jgi:hypothetical protein